MCRIEILERGITTKRMPDFPESDLRFRPRTSTEAGKLAQDNGKSKATKDYGKMLVTDETSADQQVMALAKDENIDLSASTPVVGTNYVADLTAGSTFDRRFARSMVDDHRRRLLT